MNTQGFAADRLRFYSRLSPSPPTKRGAFRFTFGWAKLFLRDPFVVNDLVAVTLQFLVCVSQCSTTYLRSASFQEVKPGSRKVSKDAFQGWETCLSDWAQWRTGLSMTLFRWRLLREEEVGFHLPHQSLPLPAPPLMLSLYFPNQQVLPQSAAAAAPWRATMLPDQSDCTQAETQSQHIHMLVTFTAFRGLVSCDFIDT